jgi:chorismate mutase
MEVSERIGRFKEAHNVAILQPEWWEHVLRVQMAAGSALGLSEKFVQAFMDAVHDESIRRQTSVWEDAERTVGARGKVEDL